MPQVRSNILQIQPYVPGKPIQDVQRELGLSKVVKLASNENPLGPSPKAVEAMRAALGDTYRYPDSVASALREKIAQRNGLSPKNVAVGNGSDELLTLLGIVLLSEGDSIVYGDPSFLSYRLVADRTGAEKITVPLTSDLRHDLPAMAAACGPCTKMAIVANPNNPTGTIVTQTETEAFLRDLPGETLPVMDEAYYEYVDHPNYPDTVSLLKGGADVAILRTFSKIYGLAGVRCGYMLGPEWLADAVDRAREPFDVNSLAQAAALAALDDTDHVRASQTMNRRNLRQAEALFDTLDCPYATSHGNFIWVDAKRPATDMFDALLRKGVIVRPGGIFGQPTWLRVTIGTDDEMATFEQAFREVLGR